MRRLSPGRERARLDPGPGRAAGDLRVGDTVLIGLESDAVAVPSAGAVRIPRL